MLHIEFWIDNPKPTIQLPTLILETIAAIDIHSNKYQSPQRESQNVEPFEFGRFDNFNEILIKINVFENQEDFVN